MTVNRIPLDYPPKRTTFRRTSPQTTRVFRTGAGTSAGAGAGTKVKIVPSIPGIVAPTIAPSQVAAAELPAQRLTAAMPTGGISVAGIPGSITAAGTNIFNSIGKLVPLALQIIIAVIVVKIVLWLMKKRR